MVDTKPRTDAANDATQAKPSYAKDGTSPRPLARIAGALYLINIIGGAFAISIVPAMLLVAGNPAATAHNIQTHELLYRSGLAMRAPFQRHSYRRWRTNPGTSRPSTTTSTRCSLASTFFA